MKRLTLKQNVMQGIHDMFYIWKQEFRTTFRDQGVLIFFILVPLVYPLIYSFIYTNETVRDVPTVVVDESRSSLSREYLRRVDATPEVNIVSYCADMEEAKLAMRDRVAYGIIYVPASFSEDIAEGRQTHVSVLVDMSGLLYYKSLVLANTEVSLDMNAEIAFLIPAVLMLIIQQTLLLGIGLSAGTAREHNRFRDLVPIDRHYHGTLRIVLGKGLSYLMVYAVISVYILCAVPWMFSLNRIAQPGELTLFTLPYLAACIFFSMTASAAIRNRETCMLLFVFTSVPLLFLSGISWPESAMPDFWRYFAHLFPSTFGIKGYVRINSMGATLNEVATEYRALWLQAGIYFITTCLVYRWQIIQSRKHVIEAYKAQKAKRTAKK